MKRAVRELSTVIMFTLGIVMVFGLQANAAESIRLGGPIGGSDIRSALLPTPGFYAGVIGSELDGFALYGPGSQQQFPDFKSSGLLGGVGALYVYDVDLFGGRIASGGFADIERDCAGLTSSTKVCASGPADPYVDALIWSKFFPSAAYSEQDPKRGPPIPFGLAIAPGFGLFLPIGNYDVNRPVNPGGNHWIVAPNIAVTYTARGLIGDATELSARLFYNAQFKNAATDYRSGDIINVDFALSERFGPFQAGIAGTYYQQVNDDIQFGQPVYPNGKRAAGLQLGPVLSYDFMIQGRPFFIKAKSLFGVSGENTVGANISVLTIGAKLF